MLLNIHKNNKNNNRKSFNLLQYFKNISAIEHHNIKLSINFDIHLIYTSGIRSLKYDERYTSVIRGHTIVLHNITLRITLLFLCNWSAYT